MIVVPTNLSSATDLIHRLQERINDYRAQLDNLTAIQVSTATSLERASTELKESTSELEHLRDDIDTLLAENTRLQDLIAAVCAERDDWRARAAVNQ